MILPEPPDNSPEPAPHRKEVRLASAALQAAFNSNWDAAVRYIQRIDRECQPDGMLIAMQAWIDTYLDHATDGDMSPAKARIGFVDTTTGQFDRPGSNVVPERVQWAGRLMTARAAMDAAEWIATLDALPRDEEEVGSYVLALLQCVAMTINGMPRGYALMGRSA